jgi:hypothetical protein
VEYKSSYKIPTWLIDRFKHNKYEMIWTSRKGLCDSLQWGVKDVVRDWDSTAKSSIFVAFYAGCYAK